MDNVITLIEPDESESPDAILEKAKGEYEDVFVIGWSKENQLSVISSANMPAQEALWLLELVKKNLLEGNFRDG